MNKGEIKAFFDALAPCWDENQKRKDEIINFILDKSDVSEGVRVLDVACGTGVLFGDYLSRGVSSVTGIDISGEMLKVAEKKFPDVKLICADAEEYVFTESYDVIMIYNAFPHFSDSDKLFFNLSKALKNAGRLTVAHGMSMKELEKCHSGSAIKVSLPLPENEALAKIMSAYLDVDIQISDDMMYMVSGTKK